MYDDVAPAGGDTSFGDSGHEIVSDAQTPGQWLGIDLIVARHPWEWGGCAWPA